MVFNDDYDRSLWLLVKSDIENRIKVNFFIKNIPFEFFNEIKDKLISVNEYRKNNLYLDNKIPFHGSCIAGYKKYYYLINPYNYALSLGYSMLNEYNDYDELYEFTVFPFSDLDLYGVKNNLLVAIVEYDVCSSYWERTKDIFLSTGKLDGTSFKVLYELSSRGEILNMKIINRKKLKDNIVLNRNNKLVRKRSK